MCSYKPSHKENASPNGFTGEFYLRNTTDSTTTLPGNWRGWNSVQFILLGQHYSDPKTRKAIVRKLQSNITHEYRMQTF